ncbi:unknown protein [Rivularia sp. IAM M-261]|nr:unknown protein [Calothrix sp. PCC 7716]GJD22468.1 unknown protein [Rivularia sp. IAM M-261]
MSNNYIVRQLVTIGITSLLLTSTTIVLAEYKPPRGQRPPSGRTTTTGSRGGCETNSETYLKLLAPQKHVGQTASIRPTFAWFVPDSKPLPIEFKLYKYDDKGEPQLQQQFLMQSKYGIMSLSLPKNKPSLKVGKRYLWQVVILCYPDQPANNLVAMAEIDVVKMPAQVRMQRDDQANVDILAEAGLWYDALGRAIRLGQKDIIHDLLKNLTALEIIEQPTTLTP